MEQQDDTKKIISERLDRIPKEVKDAILSVDYANNLQEVIKRNRLMIDQAGKLEMETTLVLLGLEPLSDYTTNIAKELDVPMSTAISIANDVNQLIFRSIRDALQKMNDEDTVAEEEEGDFLMSARPSSGLGIGTFKTPDRDTVLSEIENPVSTKAVTTTESRVPEISVTATPKVSQKEPTIEIKQSAPNIQNMIESKLQTEVSLPRQEIKIEDKSKLPPKTDPYREPIM